MERLDADEAKTIQGLIATMRYINEKTFADGGHAIRSVHAKTHGILEGCLEVKAGLPSDLAQGLFATPGRYPIGCGSPRFRETFWMTACPHRAVWR